MPATEIPAPPRTVTDEVYARNEGRAMDAGHEPCHLCGKGVRANKGWDVWIIDGGSNLLAVTEWDTRPYRPDSGDMGIHILGPECAKTIPLTHRARSLI
jgi:hypothetical protein